MKKLLIAFLFPMVAFGQGTPTLRFNTVADMVAKSIPTVNNSLTALVTGRVTANDGGGGTFYFTAASVTATNLGTVFPSTGVSGRWFRQFEGPLSAAWFGTVGDGVTDNASALQSAINTLTEWGTLSIPSGRFVVSTSLSLTNKSRSTIQGFGPPDSGPYRSQIIFTGASGVLLDGYNSAGDQASIKFQNLSMTCSTVGAGTAIRLNCQRARIEECSIINFGIGVHLLDTGSSIVENVIKDCTIQGSTTNAVYSQGANITDSNISGCVIADGGIKVANGDGWMIGPKNRVFQAPSASASGIESVSGTQLKIFDNFIEWNGTGINVTVTSIVEGMQIFGNNFVVTANNLTFIRITNNATGRVMVSGNQFHADSATTGVTGISIAGSQILSGLEAFNNFKNCATNIHNANAAFEQVHFENGVLTTTSDIQTSAAGKGLKIKEGGNARMGVSVLNGGSPASVVVANTTVTSSTRIYLTGNADGGTVGFVRVSARTASTSFTITSSANGDTSTVAWFLVEPSP